MVNRILKRVPAFAFACAMSVNAYAAADTYTVMPGDSLWIISNKAKVGLAEIIVANPQFKNPNLIYPGDRVNVPAAGQSTVSMQEQILALVNMERAKNSITPVILNDELSRVAEYKSKDMRDLRYFSHSSPIYGSPFDMLKKFNITYRTAGENIAKGQTTAESVMYTWLSSEGHRRNIMNPSYKEMGLGFCSGGETTYWTQLFISK